MKSWPVLAFLCLAACGDSTSPDAGIVREFAFDDPVGDTALFAGSEDSFPALDVRRVSGVVTADSLILTLELTTPIVPVSDAAPNSLAVLLGIDADDDSTTGSVAVTDPFPNRADAMVEYWILTDDMSGGNAEAQSALTGDPVGVFPTSYGPSSITMRIPLSAIGVRAGGRFRMVGVIGTSQRSTDLIPDSASYVLGGTEESN